MTSLAVGSEFSVRLEDITRVLSCELVSIIHIRGGGSGGWSGGGCWFVVTQAASPLAKRIAYK